MGSVLFVRETGPPQSHNGATAMLPCNVWYQLDLPERVDEAKGCIAFSHPVVPMWSRLCLFKACQSGKGCNVYVFQVKHDLGIEQNNLE